MIYARQKIAIRNAKYQGLRQICWAMGSGANFVTSAQKQFATLGYVVVQSAAKLGGFIA